MNNHAENAVKCVEIKVKASMASTNVPVQWWSDVATSVVIMLNLTPMTKNIVSRDHRLWHSPSCFSYFNRSLVSFSAKHLNNLGT